MIVPSGAAAGRADASRPALVCQGPLHALGNVHEGAATRTPLPSATMPSLRVSSLFRIVASSACAIAFIHCVGADPSTSPGGAPSGSDGSSTEAGGEGRTDAGAAFDASDAPAALLTDAVSIAAGRSHTCAINAAQEVLCWGSNGAGQLGVPIAQVPRTSIPVKVDIGGKATAIAAGGAHTCAILSTGAIRCWGSNERGQLGRGTLVPTGAVDGVSPPFANAALWTTAEVISAGASFTCAGMSQGNFGGLPDRRFFCWGENIARQSGTESTNGQPSTTPSLITQSGNDSPSPGYEGFTVTCGDDFACAGVYGAAGAATFSAVGCWGSRTVGQIGAPPINGFEVNPRFPSRKADGTTAPVYGLFKVGLVATGSAHGCVRFEQGGVNPTGLDCWGNNTHGQTGSAVTGARPATAVAGFDGTSVTVLAAGGQNTCVITNGQVKCVGANDLGQLGRGSVDPGAHATFEDAKLPPSASALAIGTSHACAILGTAAGQKGPVSCWGLNQSGQLGDGLDIDLGYPGEPDRLKRVRATPVKVLAAK